MYTILLLLSFFVCYTIKDTQNNITWLYYSGHVFLYYFWSLLIVCFYYSKLYKHYKKFNLNRIFILRIITVIMLCGIITPFKPNNFDLYSNLHILFSSIGTILFFYLLFEICCIKNYSLYSLFISLLVFNCFLIMIIGSISIIIEQSLIISSLYILKKLEKY